MRPKPPACCVCGEPERGDALDPTGEHDLRPYGPGGQPICWLCASKPEREEETNRQIGAAFDAISDRGEIPAITDAGIFPWNPKVES